jgi:hypothetical protein
MRSSVLLTKKIMRAIQDVSPHQERAEADEREQYRQYIGLASTEAPLDVGIGYARQTLGNALARCSNPDTTLTAWVFTQRMTQVLSLTYLVRTLEAQLHDWKVYTGERVTIRKLETQFQEAVRHNHIRFGGVSRSNRSDILSNVARRLQEDYEQLRRLEQEMRVWATDATVQDEIPFYSDDPQRVIEAIISGALTLEAHFEDRIFGPREITA